MASIAGQSITTIIEYLTYLETVRDNQGQLLWFRGVGDASFPLLPSLYRHTQHKTIEKLVKIEESILRTFQQRSVSFLEKPIGDPWEWLFFMQHYGVPTRLLDWTESPMIALFFAVTTATHKIVEPNDLSFASDAAVWVWKPAEWNEKALELESFVGKVLSPPDPYLRGYAPAPDCGDMRPPPLAIFGVHNSRRIVAQRGVFTVFGKSTKPAEKFYQESSFPDGLLHKLTLPKASLPSLSRSLQQHGMVDSVAFPELEGLAREIRRQLRFSV